MSEVWHTKYGARRVRRDPPTIAEAIDAASGLSDDPQEQVDIAASLMQLSPDEVRAEMKKAGARKVTMVAGRAGLTRAVVVERRTPRRPGITRYVV
jgi:2-phospho-L-lactate guanylyltransferase (CobY/MobA/RfbA family)